MKFHELFRLINEDAPIKVNSVATLIFDQDNRCLILKRGKTAPWMPLKWNLPGGGIEDGDTEQGAAVRETFEETQLTTTKLIKLKVYASPEGWAVQYFVAPANTWSGQITLNYENVEFAWVGPNDLNSYDFIPTLKEAITLAFSKLIK